MFQPQLVRSGTEILSSLGTSPGKLRERRPGLLPGVSPAVPERRNAALPFRKERGREKSFCPTGAVSREASTPRERKLPVPWCLSRLRKARALDLTNPLRSLRPPSPRLPCAHNLPHSRARTGSSHRLFPFTAFAPSESRGRGRNLVKEGPQGEIPRRHRRAMHQAMHRTRHRSMPAPPGDAPGPLQALPGFSHDKDLLKNKF